MVLKHFWIKIASFFNQNTYLNQFSIKIIHKDLIYFKIFINFDLKMFQYLRRQKCFNNPKLYTTDTHFYNSSIKMGSISFFSSSDTRKFHHVLEFHAISINSSLKSLKFFTSLQLILHLLLNVLCLSNLICKAKSLIGIIVSGSSFS